jgi:prephenate dehydratase
MSEAPPVLTAPAAGPRHVRCAYLGPDGTFTQAALRALPGTADVEEVGYPTVPDALDAVRRGEVDAAVVPMENSVEGSVNATLDELVAGAPLVITAEVVLPVSFDLLARPGTRLADVTRVLTHPHAEAQTRRWLHANLPAATVLPAGSTALAASVVADPTSGYDAAVANPLAGPTYGLVALASGIHDTDAHTRFVLVTTPGRPLPPSGADKTTLTVYMREDRTGALLEILEQFATRGVNLTRIESRPTREELGRYCFSIDCEGHVLDARVGEALMGLHRVCADVAFHGSYARADGAAPLVAPGTSDADFGEAERWLARLRGTPPA